MMKMLELNSLEFATNPDAILSEIRKKEGLYPYKMPDGTKVWLATRRKDVETVLTEEKIFK